MVWLILGYASSSRAQIAPISPGRPWHGAGEQQIESDAKQFREPKFSIEPNHIYSLPELIDLAESHNPKTRVAWEDTRARLAALGVARSELYPVLCRNCYLADESRGGHARNPFLSTNSAGV